MIIVAKVGSSRGSVSWRWDLPAGTRIQGKLLSSSSQQVTVRAGASADLASTTSAMVSVSSQTTEYTFDHTLTNAQPFFGIVTSATHPVGATIRLIVDAVTVPGVVIPNDPLDPPTAYTLPAGYRNWNDIPTDKNPPPDWNNTNLNAYLPTWGVGPYSIGDPSKIKSVRIESHDASVDIIGSEPEKWKPETRETADHSLPYITAIALIDGEITDRQFEPERFKDPEVWKFLENVKVERNAELSAMYPDAVGNIVHVDLADGRRLTRRVDYPLGNAKNRLKDSAVEGKFLALVERIIGENRAKKITELVWKLDEAKNVDALMQALQMPEEK